MERNSDLYQQVVKITADYLGPASRRFIDRQISSHLEKQPEELDYNDLAPLQEWLEVAMALLTEDKSIINEYMERIQALSSRKAANRYE